jgi:hypothetical protein
VRAALGGVVLRHSATEKEDDAPPILLVAIHRIRTVKTAVGRRRSKTERPSSRGELGGGRLPVPGQELVELPDVVIVDAGEHVGEPGLRVDVVEPRELD